MALFQYVGFFNKKKIKGKILSENISEAKYILSKSGYVIIELSSFSINREKFCISKKELLFFTQELSQLLHAGLNLYEVLLILKEKYEKNNIHLLILDLCDQIKRGKSFSSSISLYKKIFDMLYCSMVLNAEKSGTLAETLDEIANILKKYQKLKKKILFSILYPSMLFVFCISLVLLLLLFVIPSLFELFEGKDLHPLTKMVLFLSHMALNMKGYFLFFLLVIACLFSFLVYFKSLKKNFQKVGLKIPFLKDLMIKVAIIRFSRSFSVLLQAGVSYLEALKLSKKVMKHPLLEKDFAIAEQKVLEGKKLSHSLKFSCLVPKLLIRVIEIAEESAKTSFLLKHIAILYEEEVENKLSYMTSLLQPILLLILGFIVGIIVLSVLLPLTDVNSFIQ